MQKAQYVAYAGRSDSEPGFMSAGYADFRRALRVCRRNAKVGYVCWHIVRIGDGLVIAQSRNAKV